jgi:tRNA(Ile)-lysidine synthase
LKAGKKPSANRTMTAGTAKGAAMSEWLDIAESRFTHALLTLTGADHVDDLRVGLAVSGGPDSMAMLILAHRVVGDRCGVATVDHGLRSEAAEEAAFVASFCNERGIPHQILRPEKPITGNIQSEARNVRYALLNGWAAAEKCDWIATAHHADDQLETLLMRVARGAGISGLSAIRARNDNVIRPLLAFTKEELVRVCEESGLVPCDDPSNRNSEFDRVRIRQWLAQSDPPFSPTATLRSTSALAQCHEALEWMAIQLESERIAESDQRLITINPDNIPVELQRRLLLRAIARLDPDLKVRGAAIDRALESLRMGQKSMIGDWLCTGGKQWTVAPAPQRRI